MADESTVPEETDNSFDDVSLDAFNETVEETPAETETSPVEDKTTEETSDEEQTPDNDETSTESEESEQSEDTDEQVDLKSMSRRERAAYFATEREQQRIESQAKQEVVQAVSQAYQPQDVQDLQQQYMEAGYSEGESLMLARQDVAEQKAQIADATTQIAELNADLRVDAVEAQAKYEWMNPNGKTYDKETTAIAAQMFELATVKDERTGQIVDTKMTPSQVGALIDKIRTSAMKEAGIKAQKNAESQMASVAPPTSARQPSKSGNSLKDMEERLKDATF